MRTQTIELAKIVPDPAQPRQNFDEAEMTALMESIKTRGLLLPLRVQPAGADGRHRLVCGHRRREALARLGRPDAPCIIVDGPQDAAAILAEQLAENIIRSHLNPIEEARGYARYMALRHLTAAQAALELSVPAPRISRTLALLELPPEYLAAVEAGRVAKDTAYHLSRLPAGPERDAAWQSALNGTLTRDAAQRATKPASKVPTTAAMRRVACRLAGGRALTLSGPGIDLDAFIDTLDDILRQARKARSQGHELGALPRLLADRLTQEARS